VYGGYRVGDDVVGVRSTSDAFGSWLDDVLASRRAPPPDRPLYSVVVGDSALADGAGARPLSILYRGPLAMIRTRSARTVGRALLVELGGQGLRDRQNALYVRAVVARSQARTVLLPSVFAPVLRQHGRWLRRMGITLSPSTIAAVDPASGRILPPTAALDVDEDAVARLEALLPDDPKEQEQLFIDDPSSVDVVVTAVPDGRVFPLQEMTRAETLRHAIPGVLNGGRLGADAIRGLGRMLGGAECYGIGTPKPDLGTVLMILRPDDGGRR
jgi:hypothetical protein